MKYGWKFKLDCVLKYKNGQHIDRFTGSKYHDFMKAVRRWVQDFNDLGIDGLKHRSVNKKWLPEERFELVAKVLAGDSIQHVSKLAHISDGQLYQWLKKYEEKGMSGLNCIRKGRPSKNGFSIKTMAKKKTKLTPSEKEEIELLRKRNEYLELENQYLKKLRALELEKTAKLAKAKKQKSSLASKKKTNVT
ncbi:MAG: helix-turn-helix domain-containing protein [Methanomicrobia archaeon]|nr:helix-turn-helix domain-containing protein [Methanomicrobia archaeon]